MAYLQVDISSYLLGYSNKGRNPSADIELNMIKTYKVPNYLLFCRYD